MNAIKKFMQDEEGAAAVEYGLLVALIAAGIIVAVGDIGTKLKAAFEFVASKLPTLTP